MTSISQQNQSTAPLLPIDPIGHDLINKTAPMDAEAFSAPLPELKVTRKLKIPTGVSSNSKQHVVLVRDRSSSMRGSKIDELNLASVALAQILADPENKDGFLVSIVDFNHTADRPSFAHSAIGFTVPEAISSGGTCFDKAVAKCIQTVDEFNALPNPDGWKYLRPQVLFLSDGQSHVSDQNIQDLQEIANVTTIAYGSDANTQTLSRIASDGQVHVVGTKGGELRKFLADVGQTLSQDLATAR
jgi:uncharacterized protein YegL